MYFDIIVSGGRVIQYCLPENRTVAKAGLVRAKTRTSRQMVTRNAGFIIAIAQSDRPSIGAVTPQGVSGCLFLGAFNRGGGFALAHLGGLFMVFALEGFGYDTGFFAGALETAHRDIEWFVVSYSY